MYQLYWQANKFIAPEEVERSHFLSLEKNHDRIVAFLKACGFGLDSYKVVAEDVIVYKNIYNYNVLISRKAKFKEQDEGKGFCICLHLIGYWLADPDWDLVIESIRPYLHPILFAALIKYFYHPTYNPK